VSKTSEVTKSIGAFSCMQFGVHALRHRSAKYEPQQCSDRSSSQPVLA